MKDILFRKIIPSDDIYLHNIITYVMHEFGANPDGTVLADPSIKNMYQYYKDNGSVYFVAVVDGFIAGAAELNSLKTLMKKCVSCKECFCSPGTGEWESVNSYLSFHYTKQKPSAIRTVIWKVFQI